MKNKWLIIGAVAVVGYLWWKNKSKKTTSTGATDTSTDTSTDTLTPIDDSATM
jgi:hypothetical protein